MRTANRAVHLRVVHEARIEAQFPNLDSTFAQLLAEGRRELERRENVYRRGLPPLELKGKTVILADDGIATGSTMLAAIRAARKAGAAKIIVAAPVASPEAVTLLASEADSVIVLQTPVLLFSIGEWYEHFEQLEDSEVRRLLELNRNRRDTSIADPH